jgi:hypothetical protein
MTPPPLQHWLNAVLLLCVSLVHGIATTLGMWWKIEQRDWHTPSDVSALPQAKDDIQLQKDTSTHGVILGLVPRISVGAPKGLAADPLEKENRDSRHKAENDSVAVALFRVALSLSFRAKAQRAVDPEPRGHNHRRRHVQLLGSGSRLGASGMTPLVSRQH